MFTPDTLAPFIRISVHGTKFATTETNADHAWFQVEGLLLKRLGSTNVVPLSHEEQTKWKTVQHCTEESISAQFPDKISLCEFLNQRLADGCQVVPDSISLETINRVLLASGQKGQKSQKGTVTELFKQCGQISNDHNGTIDKQFVCSSNVSLYCLGCQDQKCACHQPRNNLVSIRLNQFGQIVLACLAGW